MLNISLSFQRHLNVAQASQAATPVEQPKAVAAPKPAPDPKVRQHSLWLIPFISQRLYFWRSVHIQYIFHISNICMQLHVFNISMHIHIKYMDRFYSNSYILPMPIDRFHDGQVAPQAKPGGTEGKARWISLAMSC